MREHLEPRPRDDKDTAQDIAGELASLKGEAHASLHDPNYNTLKHRLESSHSAVEAALLLRPGGGYGLTRGDSLQGVRVPGRAVRERVTRGNPVPAAKQL